MQFPASLIKTLHLLLLQLLQRPRFHACGFCILRTRVAQWCFVASCRAARRDDEKISQIANRVEHLRLVLQPYFHSGPSCSLGSTWFCNLSGQCRVRIACPHPCRPAFLGRSKQKLKLCCAAGSDPPRSKYRNGTQATERRALSLQPIAGVAFCARASASR